MPWPVRTAGAAAHGIYTDEFPARPDLIILQVTKNTLSDLAWLWRRGLAAAYPAIVRGGCAILGICGGYQIW